MADNREKLFVIAIGGTGMRCLESFVHLCAIGMFDNREINILTLDTDSNNGNKSKVQRLINEYYNRIRRDGDKESEPQANTFFSAKLNFYEFTTNYEATDRQTYSKLATVGSLKNEADKKKNQALMDLFLDSNVQNFNLEHGYRAQTHLGSMLMYNGIVEAAKVCRIKGDDATSQQKALGKYLDALSEANSQQNGRLFVFGSVFGGTGASSIPIIPKALQEAVKAKSAQQTASLDFNNIKVGAALLTQYFKFAPVNSSALQNEKIIADSENFALNSQAALQFYVSDSTVKSTYKRLYHVGWPFDRVFYGKENKVATGGDTQKNACHVAELMCACAAYDFFSLNRDDLSQDSASYMFKSIKCDVPAGNSNSNEKIYEFNPEFFMGSSGDLFRRKLGAFTSLALLVLGHQAASNKQIAQYPQELVGMTFFTKSKEGGKPIFTDPDLNYGDLNNDIDALEAVDEYLREFGYSYEGAEFKSGWLFQIDDSIKSAPGTFFINPQCFIRENVDIVNPKVDMGEVFTDVTHNFYQEKNMWGGKRKDSNYKKSHEIFEKKLKDPNNKPRANQLATTLLEKLIAHLYNALMASQN